MEYCTVDFIANATLSIIVRPVSVRHIYKYYGGNPGEFEVQRMLENYPCSNIRSCIFHCDVKSWPSNKLSCDSRARVYMVQDNLSNLEHMSCLGARKQGLKNDRRKPETPRSGSYLGHGGTIIFGTEEGVQKRYDYCSLF